MNWNPSIKQLEMIADMSTARLPSHKIAKMLGIELEEFVAWGIRTASAVELPWEPPSDSDFWQPEQKQASPKIVAERLFETSRD